MITLVGIVKFLIWGSFVVAILDFRHIGLFWETDFSLFAFLDPQNLVLDILQAISNKY